MRELLLVGAGGFLGAVARYGISLLASRAGAFPWATLGINVLGCLLIGLLMGKGGAHPALGEPGRLFLVVGILGGFTTFSAFGHETVTLLRDGRTGAAAAYVAASVLVGLGAVLLGRLATGLFSRS